MKHIFVVNPAAGPYDATDEIKSKLESLSTDVNYEIYKTEAKGDATDFVKKTCMNGTDEYRFYACGGDGTLNEVVSGALGFDNASVGVFPCGSGNDFIKYYGTAADFSNIDELINGVEHSIDVMKIGDKYAVNMVNFGFDTAVVKNMEKVKRFKLFGGKRSYYVGVLTALINAMKTPCRVFSDGKRVGKDSILLCTVGNGKYVGGSFKCSPRSNNDDGLLEVCLVDPISRFKFLKLIKFYIDGTHLDDPKLSGIVNYCRGKFIEVESDDGIYFCIDGEMNHTTRFEVGVLEKAIRFVVPSGVAKRLDIKECEEVVG